VANTRRIYTMRHERWLHICQIYVTRAHHRDRCSSIPCITWCRSAAMQSACLSEAPYSSQKALVFSFGTQIGTTWRLADCV